MKVPRRPRLSVCALLPAVLALEPRIALGDIMRSLEVRTVTMDIVVNDIDVPPDAGFTFLKDVARTAPARAAND